MNLGIRFFDVCTRADALAQAVLPKLDKLFSAKLLGAIAANVPLVEKTENNPLQN